MAMVLTQDDVDAIATAVLAAMNATPPACAVSDKTGFKLASDGLDAISTTTPSGTPSTWNFRQRLMWLYRRFFGKATKDADANTIIVYAENGSTPMTTQTTAVTGSTETQGESA